MFDLKKYILIVLAAMLAISIVVIIILASKVDFLSAKCVTLEYALSSATEVLASQSTVINDLNQQLSISDDICKKQLSEHKAIKAILKKEPILQKSPTIAAEEMNHETISYETSVSAIGLLNSIFMGM